MDEQQETKDDVKKQGYYEIAFQSTGMCLGQIPSIYCKNT